MLKPWFSSVAQWLNTPTGVHWSRVQHAPLVHGVYGGAGAPFYSMKEDSPVYDRWAWQEPMVCDLWWGVLPGDDALETADGQAWWAITDADRGRGVVPNMALDYLARVAHEGNAS
jgi:hypothetical protein